MPTAKAKLAKALRAPAGVRELDLSGGGLTELPAEISKLKDLVRLDLSHNQLTRLPPTFRDLHALVILDVSHNQLETLEGTSWLPRLEALNAHGNRLTTIPHGFDPPRLRELYLGGCTISGSDSTHVWTLTGILGQRPTLERLGLDATSLGDTKDLGALHHLTMLRVSGKPTAKAKQALRAHVRCDIEYSDEPPRIVTPVPPKAKPLALRRRPLAKTQAEQRKKLDAAARTAKFPVAELDALVRAQIRLVARKATKADLAVGATRIGGQPDLAPATPWPARDGVPKVFKLQIRLEDVAPYDFEGLLPATGLLLVFEGNVIEDSTVVYEPDVAVVAHRAFPKKLPEWASADAWGIDIAGDISIPASGEHTAPSAPAYAKLETAYGKSRRRPPRGTHRLLGYGHNFYAPMQLPEQELLLMLDTDDEVGWNFGDAGCMFVYIDRARLVARDFSKLAIDGV